MWRRRRIAEQTVNVPVAQNLEEIVEVVRLVPSPKKIVTERISEPIVQSTRLCGGVSASDFETSVEMVIWLRLGTNCSERICEQIVQVHPFPQAAEQFTTCFGCVPAPLNLKESLRC